MMPYPFGYIWLMFHKIQNSGWAIYNKRGLPIVCFGKKNFELVAEAALLVSKKIIDSGKAWLSVYKINGVNTLRVMKK